MENNNKTTSNEDIRERLDSNDELVDNLIKKTTELEKQVLNKPEIKTPDYSVALDNLTNEIKDFKETYKNDRQEITDKLDKFPKSATRQLRILFFPETNQGQYYKIVFSRLIPWGILFVVITYIFIAGYKAIGIYRYVSS